MTTALQTIFAQQCGNNIPDTYLFMAKFDAVGKEQYKCEIFRIRKDDVHLLEKADLLPPGEVNIPLFRFETREHVIELLSK